MANFTVTEYKDMTAKDIMLTIDQLASYLLNRTMGSNDIRLVEHSVGLVKDSFLPVLKAANPDKTFDDEDEILVNAVYGFIMLVAKEGSSLKAEQTLTKVTGATFPEEGIAQHVISVFANNLLKEWNAMEPNDNKNSLEAFNTWLFGKGIEGTVV